MPAIMKIMRFLSPLLFAFALLFAQQGGTLHTLQHVFAEQTQHQNKKTQHTHDCEQCTTYAQLGSALNSGFLTFDAGTASPGQLTQSDQVFSSRHTFAATARGPPVFQISA